MFLIFMKHLGTNLDIVLYSFVFCRVCPCFCTLWRMFLLFFENLTCCNDFITVSIFCGMLFTFLYFKQDLCR